MSKIIVFRDIAPCSAVKIGRRFIAGYSIYHQDSVYTILHSATSCKIVIFILVTVRALHFTAVISLNGINHLVFVMEKCCVLFPVRTELLSII
jgi:hypothetical protein